jgi:hypothetical protein
MRQKILLILMIIIGAEVAGQTGSENLLQGRVSFVSTQNIYIRFKSTDGISAGDTLYILSKGNLVPSLRVTNLSSTSCVCIAISNVKYTVDQPITGIKKTNRNDASKNVADPSMKKPLLYYVPADTSKEKSRPDKLKQIVKGSLSAYSYSDFSNTGAASINQFRYTLSLNMKNIANSKFSFDNYMSFRHKLGDWGEVKSNLFNALKIYTLSVRYEPDKTTQITLGRTINPKISSIGAMDGLQLEKTFNRFAFGAVAGTRPDYTNYGFNSKLLQYGSYLVFNTGKADKYSESSVAFMQQMNNSKIDRRFVYFQHSNSLFKNLYIFGTFEVDLYQLKNDSLNVGHSKTTFNPTGIYLSLRYKMTDRLTISCSYDARKNVIYYETYKSFIDRILESELRQGYRLQANYRISNNIMFGVTSGYRFLQADPHPSKNIYSYLTYNQIPGINTSVTISGTYLESSYINSKILGASLTQNIFKGKLQTGIGFRYVDYRLTESLLNVVQNIAEMNLYWQFSKSMSFSVNYEGTFEKKDRYNRVYLQIRKRF